MPPSPLYLFALFYLPLFTSAQWEHGNSDALFNFVTRPDLKAPKWEIEVYDSEKLSDGYWFVSPYRSPRNLEDETDSWGTQNEFGPSLRHHNIAYYQSQAMIDHILTRNQLHHTYMMAMES
jgi:hypothetical protein